MLWKRWVRTLLAGAVTGAWILASTTGAATWDGGGGDGNWTTAANWIGDIAPSAGEILQFGGTTNLVTNNDFAADTLFGGIDFLAGAGSFSLAGNGILLGGDINNNSGAAQTINFAPVLVEPTAFTYNAGGLVLDGTTSNVNVLAGGSLGLGQVTFGLAPKSANVSSLNLNNSVSAAGLTVQTKSTDTNFINIASGTTFTIGGSVILGTPTTTSGEGFLNTNVDFTGGGDLSVTAGNFYVGIGTLNLGGNDRNVARVDMTGLDEFSYTGGGNFGVGWMTRPDGQLRLASGSNTIVASQLHVGTSGTTGTTGGNNNGGTTAVLFLGTGTNVINTSNVTIGNIKGAGAVDWGDPGQGSVTIAGQDGVSNVAITVGRQSSATGTSTESRLALAGHDATVQSGTVIVGHMNGATSATATGAITFDTGTFNVENLHIGRNQSGSSTGGVRGSFTLGTDASSTGILNVNSSFFLGNDNNGTNSPTRATFTMNGGTANVNTNIQFVSNGDTSADEIELTLAGGTLNMMGHDIGSAASPLKIINLTGGTLANAARIAGQNTSISGPITFSGAPTFVLPDAGTLATSNPSLDLVSGGGIEGGGPSGGSITGNVVAGTGSHVGVGLNTTAATLSFFNDLSLDNGSMLSLDLSDNPLGGNDLINVSGNLTVAGTVTINIGALGAGASIGSTYTLMNYGGALTGDQTNFAVASDGSRRTYTVVDTNTTPGTIQLSVGGSAPLALTWIGNVNNEWDLMGDSNWDSAGTQQFFNLDSVTFNDTSTNPNAVQLVGDLQPASVTVEGTRNYTFAGTGSITGGATLTKQGTGTLTVTNANSYTGGTQILDGVVVIGNGGSLGTGPVVNEANLTVNRIDAVTISNVISGSGSVNYVGSGTTTVSGANTYTGATSITAGVVRLAAPNGLGSADGTDATGTSINGGTLDINNVVMNNTELFRIQGSGAGGIGAIVNNGTGGAANHVSRVTLTGNATIGGTGRWDFRGNTPNLDLAGFTLTKIGTNQISLVATNVTDGNIVVNEGTFSIETTSSVLAGSGTITYNANTNAQFFNNTGTVARQMIINGPGVSMGNAGTGSATIDSPIELRAELTLAPMTNGAVDNNQANRPLTLTGDVTEAGGARSVTKTGLNTVTLTGNLSYTGNTTVSDGTLSLSPLDGTSELADASIVSLAAGAFLHLGFSNTDTIGSLILGGTPAQAGIWGAESSGAQFTSPLLTGTGLLNVAGASLLGDYNNDGRVDAADYVVWRKTINTQEKYDEWRANFGQSSPGSGASLAQSAVPEPSMLGLVLWCIAISSCVAGRRLLRD